MPSSSLWRPRTVPTRPPRPGSSQRPRGGPRPESPGPLVRGVAGLAAPVIALAVAVSASRVMTGVPYPSDVLAGAAIGCAAGAMTVRWWPRRPATPAAVIRSPRRVPASSAGDGLVLVVNTGAGTVLSKLVQWPRAELPQAVLIQTAPR